MTRTTHVTRRKPFFSRELDPHDNALDIANLTFLSIGSHLHVMLSHAPSLRQGCTLPYMIASVAQMVVHRTTLLHT
jgi:hypothetical protein